MAADGSIPPSSHSIPLFFARDPGQARSQDRIDAEHLVDVKEALRGTALPEYRLAYDQRPQRVGSEEYSKLNIVFDGLPEDTGMRSLRAVIEKRLKLHKLDQHMTLGSVSLSAV
jgi:hypothetical protein